MVAAGSPFIFQTHCSQSGGYGPFARGEDRACEQDLGMPPDIRSENDGAKGARICIILVGRVRTGDHLFERSVVTSVPYPFHPQMAKVQLRIPFQFT